ncbi:MAG: MFS transporter, partial [Verrucomicrobia bacterium]|nr:MFS transporter [Verrucomicrobiota bacterium]
GLDFWQVGLITFTFQFTASLLQPLVGLYTDRRPLPYSLAAGMAFTLSGLVLLSQAHNYGILLIAAGLVGVGSSVFHPEASRVARLASGGKFGLAQSLFQVGGNAGASMGPLLAALIVVPHGQTSVLWFSALAFTGIVVLSLVGRWYQGHMVRQRKAPPIYRPANISRGRVLLSLGVLLLLMFSKFFYLTSISSYYTFYLIDRFHVSVPTAQIFLFVFLFAVAAGTIIGGPVGDRIGRKYVIWVSILGVAPFTLALPYSPLWLTAVLSVIIGLILASAFSAIVVYAQELVPGKVGTVAGIYFGLAFGLGGVGSAFLGGLIDHTSIRFVYQVCSFLPLIGLLTVLLPNLEVPSMQKRT